MKYSAEKANLGVALSLLEQLEARQGAPGLEPNVKVQALALAQVLLNVAAAEGLIRLKLARLCESGGSTDALLESLRRLEEAKQVHLCDLPVPARTPPSAH